MQIEHTVSQGRKSEFTRRNYEKKFKDLILTLLSKVTESYQELNWFIY